jgi:hypothetical protein
VLIFVVSTGSVLVLLLVVALLRERRLRRALEVLLRRFLIGRKTDENDPTKAHAANADDRRPRKRMREE